MTTRHFKRQQDRKKLETSRKLIQRLPKPASENGHCACGCHHLPDKGACPKFRRGPNDHCVICDHGILCHRRKGEAPPKTWNVPKIFTDPRALIFFPNDATACPDCKAKAMICPTCKNFVPLKESTEGIHLARCPKCGGFDQDCPKAKQ